MDDWGRITASYHSNMDALRTKTLAAGKFAWQLMWTGGNVNGVGNTCPHPIVSKQSCAQNLRSLCNETAPPQTRAMMYALNAHDPGKLLDVAADLANFLLVRGPFAWLGHGACALLSSSFRRSSPVDLPLLCNSAFCLAFAPHCALRAGCVYW